MTAENLDFLLHGIFIQTIRTLFIYTYTLGFWRKHMLINVNNKKNEFGKIIILY